jgi:hypothetical protein
MAKVWTFLIVALMIGMHANATEKRREVSESAVLFDLKAFL